jgi:hypothetical protein
MTSNVVRDLLRQANPTVLQRLARWIGQKAGGKQQRALDEFTRLNGASVDRNRQALMNAERNFQEEVSRQNLFASNKNAIEQAYQQFISDPISSAINLRSIAQMLSNSHPVAIGSAGPGGSWEHQIINLARLVRDHTPVRNPARGRRGRGRGPAPAPAPVQIDTIDQALDYLRNNHQNPKSIISALEQSAQERVSRHTRDRDHIAMTGISGIEEQNRLQNALNRSQESAGKLGLGVAGTIGLGGLGLALWPKGAEADESDDLSTENLESTAARQMANQFDLPEDAAKRLDDFNAFQAGTGKPAANAPQKENSDISPELATTPALSESGKNNDVRSGTPYTVDPKEFKKEFKRMLSQIDPHSKAITEEAINRLLKQAELMDQYGMSSGRYNTGESAINSPSFVQYLKSILDASDVYGMGKGTDMATGKPNDTLPYYANSANYPYGDNRPEENRSGYSGNRPKESYPDFWEWGRNELSYLFPSPYNSGDMPPQADSKQWPYGDYTVFRQSDGSGRPAQSYPDPNEWLRNEWSYLHPTPYDSGNPPDQINPDNYPYYDSGNPPPQMNADNYPYYDSGNPPDQTDPSKYPYYDSGNPPAQMDANNYPYYDSGKMPNQADSANFPYGDELAYYDTTGMPPQAISANSAENAEQVAQSDNYRTSNAAIQAQRLEDELFKEAALKAMEDDLFKEGELAKLENDVLASGSKKPARKAKAANSSKSAKSSKPVQQPVRQPAASAAPAAPSPYVAAGLKILNGPRVLNTPRLTKQDVWNRIRSKGLVSPVEAIRAGVFTPAEVRYITEHDLW